MISRNSYFEKYMCCGCSGGHSMVGHFTQLPSIVVSMVCLDAMNQAFHILTTPFLDKFATLPEQGSRLLKHGAVHSSVHSSARSSVHQNIMHGT